MSFNLFPVLSCPPLPIIFNGARHCVGLNLCGAECTHTCGAGYTLSGNPTAICQANEQWATDFPSCQRKYSVVNDRVQFQFQFLLKMARSARLGPFALCPVSWQSLQGCPRNSAQFVWLNTDRSRPWRVECRPLPFSTPLSFRRSML